MNWKSTTARNKIERSDVPARCGKQSLLASY